MITRATFIWLLIASALFVGCIHFPSVDPATPKMALRTGTPQTALLEGVTARPQIKVDQSHFSDAVQTYFNWIAGISIAAGAAGIAFGIFLIASVGATKAGAKYIAAGFTLPLVCIFIAFYWKAISLTALIGFIVFVVVTHWTMLRKIFVHLKNQFQGNKQLALL